MNIKRCCNKPLYLFIFTSLVTNILFISYYDLSSAQKDKEDKEEDEDKLIVKTRIHLKNIDVENTKLIRVVAFINGEDIKQDIPISSIDKTKKTLNVNLKTDKENDIVDANTPDEYFVCAYQVGDVLNNYNSFTKFDCNESDLVNIDTPTVINLFRSGSLVFSKSKSIYDASLNAPKGPVSDTVKIKVYAPLADKK